MRALRIALLCVYGLVAALIGLGIWILIDDGAEPHAVAWAVGAMACAVAVPLSLHDMLMNALHYSAPTLQRHVLRILGMVPIYALESWFALRFTRQALLFETLREAYEALVLYSFYKLLLAFLGEREVLIARMRERGATRRRALLFPLCCCSWDAPAVFLFRVSAGVLQYVIVRLVMTIVTLALAQTGRYGDGDFSPARGYFWCVGIITCSQFYALYCLALFYFVLHAELEPLRPVLKFLVVKSIIFVTWWQQVVIALLVAYGVIEARDSGSLNFDAADVAKGLQDLLICLEMVVLAVLMHFAFHYTEWLRVANAPRRQQAAGAGASGADKPLMVLAPAAMADAGPGLRRALFDVLPVDIIADTREMAVGGFQRHREEEGEEEEEGVGEGEGAGGGGGGGGGSLAGLLSGGDGGGLDDRSLAAAPPQALSIAAVFSSPRRSPRSTSKP